MEPSTISPGPEQLQTLLNSWQDPEITLRLVQPEEAELAAELILAASSEIRTPTQPGIEGTLQSCLRASRAGDVFLFVEHRGVPSGLLMGELYPAAQGGREFHLSHILIKPELRSSRLGSRLMSHLEGWLRRLGAGTLTLNFMADNRSVETFYRRLGYQIVGYDLLRKLPARAADPVRSARQLGLYAPGDLGRVLAFLQPRPGLSTFDQPLWTEAELVARLQALGADPQQRLLLAERDAELVGLCWSRSKLSKAGVPIVVALCFESDDLETAASLLAALDRLATEQAAIESYVTLWEPCTGQLALALERGYDHGRFKARKSIESAPGLL